MTVYYQFKEITKLACENVEQCVITERLNLIDGTTNTITESSIEVNEYGLGQPIMIIN